MARTSSLETKLISAARDSEKDAEKRFLAPWMLKLMICPFSSSFCSFRFLLSCSQQTNQMLLKHVVLSKQIRPGKAGVFILTSSSHSAGNSARSPDSVSAEPGEPLETWGMLGRSRGHSREGFPSN